MTKYLAGVLSVIAVGVSLIAYSLIVPRTLALERSVDSVPLPVTTSVGTGRTPAVERPVQGAAYPATLSSADAVHRPLAIEEDPVVTYRSADSTRVGRRARPVRTVVVEPEPEVVTRTVVRERGRDWKKTAMIVGGSTAAGAGVGGIMGGKKGALIGAAIGGGASTIYETTK